MDNSGKNKTCVIILGMHRSGTSCLAGSLQQYGLYLGEVFEKNPHNKRGNRENIRIMQLNNTLLSANGGDWKQPPSKIRWNKEHLLERDNIISSFSSRSEKLWGFKDPRTILTFNFWKEGLISVKPVGIFRHPLLVARSLYKRNNISIENGLQLWRQYNIKLLTIWEELLFPIISFDVSKEEFLKSIRFITEYLDIFDPSTSMPHFFDDSLRHYLTVDNKTVIPDEILQIYEKLKRIYFTQMQKMN